MPKPAFDPSKPFEPAQAANKPAFDPNKPFNPASEAVHGGAADTRGLSEKIKDPEIWRKIVLGDPESKVVAGRPPLALPAGALPGAVGKFADFISGSGPRRIAASAGLGAAEAEPGHRVEGALIGSGLGTLGEAAGGAAKLGGYLSRKVAGMTAPEAATYIANPRAVTEAGKSMSGLNKAAAEALQTSREALKEHGLGKSAALQELIKGKTIKITPSEYLGFSPETDALLAKHIYREPTYGTKNIHENVDVPIEVVNTLKKEFQKLSKFAQGTTSDPQTKAKYVQAGVKSHELKGKVEQSTPEAGALNKEMQDSMLLGKAIQSKQRTKPISAITSKRPDAQAIIQQAEEMAASGLPEKAVGLSTALKTQPTEVKGPASAYNFLAKPAGRLGMRAAGPAEELAKTSVKPTLAEIMQLINQNNNQGK